MLVFYNTWSIEEKAMEIAIKYECCYWSEPLCIICRHGEVLKMCTPWWNDSYQCYILNYTLMTFLSVMQQLVHNCASKKTNRKTATFLLT